jgi:urea carboxylase
VQRLSSCLCRRSCKNFQPSPGVLTEVAFPEGTRVDTWVKTGTEISQYFDPMIAKIIVHADDRASAIEKLKMYWLKHA